MRVLVLGGTSFVGPAFVQSALAGGWDVTVANRGRSGPAPAGARGVLLDRTVPGAFDAVARERFDIVVDTWSRDPRVVRDAARALGGSTDRWVYVSSRSVYVFPPPRGADETAPVVEADPDSGASDYPQDKRGAELALERELGTDRVVLLRPGLILGARDNVGRLPWWLRRIARGGPTLAPGPADLPVQYVDPRDLAALGLRAAADGRSGPVDVVCPAGSVTLRDILETAVDVTGSDAELVWVDGSFLRDEQVAPWTELPIWIPPDEEGYAFHDGDVTRALSWGMTNRPVRDTLTDAWAWVQQVDAEGTAPPSPPGIGLDPAKEAAVLSAWEARG